MSDSFNTWARLGYTPALLPVIPHDAEMSPFSEVPADQRGKVPGTLGPHGWRSYSWRGAAAAEASDLAEWAGQGAGVGARCDGLLRAVDVDVLDESVSSALLDATELLCGDTMLRVGRAPKGLLVYRAAGPLRKLKVSFWLPGDDRGPGNKPHAVELLADGQFFVMDGVHPGTGRDYAWPRGRMALAELPVLSAEGAERLHAAWLQVIEGMGGEVVASGGGGAGGLLGEAVAQDGLRAPSAAVLAAALAHVPNEGSREAWIAMGHAVKAAGGELEDWAAWSARWEGGEEDPEDLARRWAGFQGPFVRGWPMIEALARKGGWGGSAALDFAGLERGAVEGALRASTGGRLGDDGLTIQERMFAEWRWIEKVERFGSVVTGDMLTRTQFNVRLRAVGAPHSAAGCAAAVFLSDEDRLKTLLAPTYWPGQGAEVYEPLLGGMCLNRWRPGPGAPIAGTWVTADKVRPWLDHLAMLVPDERERRHLEDWMRWLLQHPGEKVNWAPVLGGRQGIGKDLLFQPLWWALGALNVKHVGVGDLEAAQTDYVLNVQVLVVNEMHSASRVALGDKLKPYIAAPPDTLRINTKMIAQYEVPNRVCVVMFTNHRDALAIEDGDRRYFVIWSECMPRSRGYYMDLVAWYMDGGAELVAGYLASTEISTGFDAAGRAPDTAAKEAMARDSRSEARAAVEDALEADDWPDIVNPEDLAARLNLLAGGRARHITGKYIGMVLRQKGAKVLRDALQIKLLEPTKTGAVRARLYAIRDAERYEAMPPAVLAREFVRGWREIEAKELNPVSHLSLV